MFLANFFRICFLLLYTATATSCKGHNINATCRVAAKIASKQLPGNNKKGALPRGFQRNEI